MPAPTIAAYFFWVQDRETGEICSFRVNDPHSPPPANLQPLQGNALSAAEADNLSMDELASRFPLTLPERWQ
jgi:hypothetical protein